MAIKRLSTKWPSSASAFDGRVRLNLNLEATTDPATTEMTPMQAMELALQLIERARDCLKSVVNG